MILHANAALSLLVAKVEALDDQLEVVAEAALQHPEHAPHVRTEGRGSLPRLERVVAPPVFDLGVLCDAQLEVARREFVARRERAPFTFPGRP
jgi:hypothetical protein